MGAFKEPHGGELKNLFLPADKAEQEKKAAREYASWDLTERQLCDIELLLNGADPGYARRHRGVCGRYPVR
jgi:sulfate adenylyltransferase